MPSRPFPVLFAATLFDVAALRLVQPLAPLLHVLDGRVDELWGQAESCAAQACQVLLPGLLLVDWPAAFLRLTDSILQLFRCPPSPPTFNIGMTPSCTLFILIFDGPGPGDAPILNVGGAGGFTARTVARLRPSTVSI